tara:strand:- start:1163 stop:1378 length:216 start_codon:yes stop_codon:yes gene_type:complete
METNKILKFYRESTPKEKCLLLNMMAKDIMVPVTINGITHCQELNMENPVCMNGPSYQINIIEDELQPTTI